MSEKWVIRDKETGRYLVNSWKTDTLTGYPSYWRWTVNNTDPKVTWRRECDALCFWSQSERSDL